MLVTSGACNIEARHRDGWQSAHYESGAIGMTAPGHEATLRWRGATTHETPQLHLPYETIEKLAADLAKGDPGK